VPVEAFAAAGPAGLCQACNCLKEITLLHGLGNTHNLYMCMIFLQHKWEMSPLLVAGRARLQGWLQGELGCRAEATAAHDFVCMASYHCVSLMNVDYNLYDVMMTMQE